MDGTARALAIVASLCGALACACSAGARNRSTPSEGVPDSGLDASSPGDAQSDVQPESQAEAAVHHYVYGVRAGPLISVYDLDKPDFALVKEVTAGNSTEGPRGVVASADGALYISYGCTTPAGCTPYLMNMI